jgi:superfamily I DNA/RNA helicase
VQRSAAEDSSKPGVRMATMHRVKGLEFDRVVVAGMSEELMPWRAQVMRSEDASVRREAEAMERGLLYVAVTRAKRGVLVTAHGKPSGWIGA